MIINNKKISCIIAMICILSVFSFGVTAFAVEDEEIEIEIGEIVADETEPHKPVTNPPATNPPATNPPATNPPERPVTTRNSGTPTQPAQRPTQPAQRPTQAPTRPASTTRPAVVTTAPAETETLPKGSFYVFIELGNGGERLKNILSKPGLVPEPDEPKREGFVFDGWYSDEKFENSWNFFTDSAEKEMTIYAKWVAKDNTKLYRVKSLKSTGGTFEVNPKEATEGETVTITAKPDEGMRVAKIYIDGKESEYLSFEMPSKNVQIKVEFEKIPVEAEKGKTLIPVFIAGAAVIVLVAIGLAIRLVANNRLKKEAEERDAPVWVDESAVVEDGFKEGKKVMEDHDPDFDALFSEENEEAIQNIFGDDE